MKLRTEIAWWIPGGRLVYSGTPKTRAEWIRLTWRGYAAFWRLMGRVIWLTVASTVPPATSETAKSTELNGARKQS